MTVDLSVFKNQGDTTDKEEDRLGYEAKPTDIYAAKIKQAYLSQSQKGAFFVHFEFEFKDGSTMRYDLYFTDKDGDTRWTKNGRSGNMPGFNKLNTLVEITLGLDKEFADLKTATKKVEVYENRQTVVEDKEVLVDLLGKEVLVGVLKKITNLRAKNDEGGYDDIPGSRIFNELDKFYQAPKGFTAAELREGAEKPEFAAKWLEKNKGKDRDERTIKSDAPAGTGSSAAPTTPIFS